MAPPLLEAEEQLERQALSQPHPPTLGQVGGWVASSQCLCFTCRCQLLSLFSFTLPLIMCHGRGDVSFLLSPPLPPRRVRKWQESQAGWGQYASPRAVLLTSECQGTLSSLSRTSQLFGMVGQSHSSVYELGIKATEVLRVFLSSEFPDVWSLVAQDWSDCSVVSALCRFLLFSWSFFFFFLKDCFMVKRWLLEIQFSYLKQEEGESTKCQQSLRPDYTLFELISWKPRTKVLT